MPELPLPPYYDQTKRDTEQRLDDLEHQPRLTFNLTLVDTAPDKPEADTCVIYMDKSFGVRRVRVKFDDDHIETIASD